MMRFQTPDDRLAVVARLDSVQHRFLKELNGWANATRGFDFGTLLGRHNLIVLVKDVGPQPFDDSDPEQVTIICKDAIDKFGSDFLDAVKADMLMIGYQIDDLALKRPDNIRPALPGDLLGIAVKEGDLQCTTDQPWMSQGMFRTLSVLIQLNYAQLANRADCIIIDDIGEGLDFERSCHSSICCARRHTSLSFG